MGRPLDFQLDILIGQFKWIKAPVPVQEPDTSCVRVTSVMPSSIINGDDNTIGIYTTTPQNKVLIRNANSHKAVLTSNKDYVFARLTQIGNEYDVLFYTLINGIEVPVNLSDTPNVEEYIDFRLCQTVKNENDLPTDIAFIDESVSEITNTKGDTFPTNQAQGDLHYYNNEQRQYYYDSERDKWLSIESFSYDFNRAGRIDTNDIFTSGTITDLNSFYNPSHKITLTGYELTQSNFNIDVGNTIQLSKVTNPTGISATATLFAINSILNQITYQKVDLNDTIEITDYLQMKCMLNSMVPNKRFNDIVGKVFYKYEKP